MTSYLLLLALSLGQHVGNHGYVFDGVSQGGGSIGDDIPSGDCVIVDENGLQGCVRTSDAAPTTTVVIGQTAYPSASSNKTGADLLLGAGSGSKTVTIDDYSNCAGDTVTITVEGTSTVLTEGVEWTAATDNDTTAASLATAISAVTGVTGVASAAVIAVTKADTAVYVQLAEGDATCTTVANGTDGKVIIRHDMDIYGLTLTYTSLKAVDNVLLSFGTAADAVISWRTAMDPDGLLLSTDNSSHLIYIAEQADRLTVFNFAGQTDPTLIIQSADATNQNQRLWFQHNQTDGIIDVGTGDIKLSNSTEVAGDALTSGGTDDYTLSLTQILNDSGAAGGSDVYRGLKLNITQTDVTGWDNVYLMDLQADGSSIFRVDASGGGNYYDTSGNAYYWDRMHIDSSAISPGGSGATLTVWNTATIGYLLDATTEYLYYSCDVESNWDASSDLVVEMYVALNAAETANDIIQAELVAEYYSEHDDMDVPKTQTRTINHDIVSDNAAGEVHELIFVLDYDLVDNVIEADDRLKLRFRLDSVAGGTDVAAVRFLFGHVKYRTTFPGDPVGTFPTEG